MSRYHDLSKCTTYMRNGNEQAARGACAESYGVPELFATMTGRLSADVVSSIIALIRSANPVGLRSAPASTGCEKEKNKQHVRYNWVVRKSVQSSDPRSGCQRRYTCTCPKAKEQLSSNSLQLIGNHKEPRSNGKAHCQCAPPLVKAAGMKITGVAFSGPHSLTCTLPY
jgi:hypothetical protein